MKRELTLFVLLCVTLSCNGFLEKLLDPLNVSDVILKGISHANKYSGVQGSTGGEHATVFEGSSSASYSYGGGTNGYGVPVQTYVQGGSPQHYIEIAQVNNYRQPVQGYGFGGPPQGNPLQEANHGNFQQANEFVEVVTHHNDALNTGNPCLTFSINLGGLFGGHSIHSHHHHSHKHHYGQSNDNSDFNSSNNQDGNINGHEQYYNQNGDSLEHIGYQNQDGPNFNQNGGYDRPEHTGNQNVYETSYVTHHQESVNYNHRENKNPSELFNNNFQNHPTQNDKNRNPDEGNYQSQDKYVSSTPSVEKLPEITYPSTTESTKSPYEFEKNSKVTTSNRKTTIRPNSDQPLLVPLNPNEYTYEGDKIQIVSPKRNADTNTQKQELNTKEEDFDIDVRFNDE